MKKYKLIAPLALGAAAALAAGVAALLKKPAEAAESAAAPAPKTPAVPKHRCVGSHSFISGFQNAVTVEMEMDYDSEKYSFVVIEDEFPSYSGDSHVAVVYGEDFNMQLEYAAYYKGEDFAGHVKTLGEKYQGIAPVRFGGVEGIRFIDGDNVCLALPIPNDASSFLLVTLMKNPGYDEDVSTLPDHPDLRYMLGTLRFTLH